MGIKGLRGFIEKVLLESGYDIYDDNSNSPMHVHQSFKDYINYRSRKNIQQSEQLNSNNRSDKINKDQVDLNEEQNDQLNKNENQLNKNENQLNKNENQLNKNENQSDGNENQLNKNENQSNGNKNQTDKNELFSLDDNCHDNLKNINIQDKSKQDKSKLRSVKINGNKKVHYKTKISHNITIQRGIKLPAQNNILPQAGFTNKSINVILVDLSYVLYKYSASLQRHKFWGLANQALKFLENNVYPIYIFDGTAPPEKKKLIQNRQSKATKKINQLLKAADVQKNKLYQDITTLDDDILLESLNKEINNTVFNLNKLCTKRKLVLDENNDKTIDVSNIEQNDYPNDYPNNNNIDECDDNICTEELVDDIWFNKGYDEVPKSKSNNFITSDITPLQINYNNGTNISYNDLLMAKHLFKLLKIPYFTAKAEADAKCAEMCKKLSNNNNINFLGCLTGDMDFLAYEGCEYIFQICPDRTVISFDLPGILKCLKLTKDQFVDMCILFGCDYVKYTPKDSHLNLYEKIIKFGSLDEFITKYYQNIDSNIINYLSHYKNAKMLFQNSPKEEYGDEKIYGISCYDRISVLDVTKFLEPFLLDWNEKERKITFLKLNIKKINKLISNGFFDVKL
jgi:hypothetical protein